MVLSSSFNYSYWDVSKKQSLLPSQMLSEPLDFGSLVTKDHYKTEIKNMINLDKHECMRLKVSYRAHTGDT